MSSNYVILTAITRRAFTRSQAHCLASNPCNNLTGQISSQSYRWENASPRIKSHSWKSRGLPLSPPGLGEVRVHNCLPGSWPSTSIHKGAWGDGADDTMMRTSGPGPRHDRALTLRSCWQRGEPRPDTCPRIGTSAQALLALPSGEGCRPGSSSRQDPASSLAPGRPVTLPPVTPQIQSQVKAWSLSPSKEPHEIFNSPFGK